MLYRRRLPRSIGELGYGTDYEDLCASQPQSESSKGGGLIYCYLEAKEVKPSVYLYNTKELKSLHSENSIILRSLRSESVAFPFKLIVSKMMT